MGWTEEARLASLLVRQGGHHKGKSRKGQGLGKRHPHKGHAQSAATRAKISAALTGRHRAGHTSPKHSGKHRVSHAGSTVAGAHRTHHRTSMVTNPNGLSRTSGNHTSTAYSGTGTLTTTGILHTGAVRSSSTGTLAHSQPMQKKGQMRGPHYLASRGGSQGGPHQNRQGGQHRVSLRNPTSATHGAYRRGGRHR